MSTVEEELRLSKRRLLLRDSFAFLSLTVISVVLFVLTWGIFESFSEHRVDLAQRWYARGQADLAANHPNQAVTSLRAALSYAPENHDYQLLLAEALAASGDRNLDEALAYFSNLWDAQPGSGILNLQLARLSVRKKQNDDAVRYYRASIYGTWEGDGTARRRGVRLELVRFLMSVGRMGAAQNELLIAAGNSSDDPAARVEIAQLMVQAGDPGSALAQYQRLLAIDPDDAKARQGAAEIAFQMGRYATVVKLLKEDAAKRQSNSTEMAVLLEQSNRILEMNPADTLPNAERVQRILQLRQIALKRWNACQTKLNAPNALPTSLSAGLLTQVQALAAEWKNDDGSSLRPALLSNPDRQRLVIDLAYRTEALANQACGAASGDDELVTLLSKSAGTVQQ